MTTVAHDLPSDVSAAHDGPNVLSSDDRPSRFPWPPVLLAGSIALALAFDRWVVPLPVPFAEMSLVKAAGWLLLAQGLGLVAWAIVTFWQHATSIRPDRAASVLLTTGPFTYSRNPIYLGETLSVFGAGLAFNRLSLVLVMPLFVLAVTRLAIRGEEAHLARRFGEAYAHYCDQAGRWL